MMYGYADSKRMDVKGAIIQKEPKLSLEAKHVPIMLKQEHIGTHHLHRMRKIENDPFYKKVEDSIHEEGIRKRINLSLVHLKNTGNKKIEFIVLTTYNSSTVLGAKIGYTKKYIEPDNKDFLVPDFDDLGKIKGYFICRPTGYEEIIKKSIDEDTDVEEALFEEKLRKRLH